MLSRGCNDLPCRADRREEREEGATRLALDDDKPVMIFPVELIGGRSARRVQSASPLMMTNLVVMMINLGVVVCVVVGV